MKILLLPRLFLFFLVIPNLLHAAADFSYLKSLIEQAQSQKLSAQREWRILVHYLPKGSGYVSEVDDPKFFNAASGKTHPQDELEATLTAFFAPQAKNSQHPQCQFIARYHWLKQKLAFNSVRLPAQSCPEFDTWLAELEPAGLTLIFPAAYLNNPSSMFGHTLLRIDRKNQTEQTRLLAYALNYAANTNETNGFVFAIKGITGGYPGLFSILPYYKKVKEYNDLENRDIWEYQLNFSEPEIHRLIRHLWELHKMYLDYYFFDDNCASLLLSLLEAARPSLHLREQLPPWVIPGETVRVVTKTPNLVKNAVFRSAKATRLRHNLASLSQQQRNWVYKLAKGEVKPENKQFLALNVTARAEVLETAYDYLSYLNKTTDKARSRRLRALLVARSRLPSKTTFTEVPIPPRPDKGHGSFRLRLAFGRDGEQNYQSLHLRPAYHDLLDPEAGYTPGAQINFLDLSLRHEVGSSVLKLEAFKVIDIVSLSPRDQFFQPISWKINTGWLRRPMDDNSRPLVYHTNGGAGLSYQVFNNTTAYGFLEGNLDIAGSLQKNYALGLGSTAGLFINPASTWRIHLYGNAQRYDLGHKQSLHEFGLEQRLSFGQNNALRLDLKRRYFDADKASSQIELSWQWYF